MSAVVSWAALAGAWEPIDAHAAAGELAIHAALFDGALRCGNKLARLPPEAQAILRTLAARARPHALPTATTSDAFVSAIAAIEPSAKPAMHALLNLAVGGLAPEGEPPRAPHEAAAFDVATRGLAALLPSEVRYHGGAPLDEETLDALRSEAEACRAHTLTLGRAACAAAGPTAGRVITQLTSLFDAIGTADLRAASYLYYDRPGDGTVAHVDMPPFSWNALLMLANSHGAAGSALRLFAPRGEVRRVALAPGELLLFGAGGLVHAREPLGANEHITLLSIAVRPPTFEEESSWPRSRS